MYEKYFGFSKKPFDITPDPNMVYMSEGYKEALAVLRYGVLDKKGFILLTGEVGTGKTTLLKLLMKTVSKNVHVCTISNPRLSIDDFYYYLSSEYSLEIYDGNKGKFLKNFEGFVEKCWEKKQQVLLVVDEAHLLPIELIEEIRLLSNQDQHILSIFLVGQPELNEYLDQKRLLPLRQRITLSFNLEPYPSGETEYYIRLRLLRAGGQQLDLFTDEAIELIHKLSKGIPRAINVLCDRALMTGLAENKRVITEDVICECAKELQLFMPEVRGQELNGRNGVWGRLKSVLSC